MSANPPASNKLRAARHSWPFRLKRFAGIKAAAGLDVAAPGTGALR
jgi:hypothetical protein